MIRIGQAYMPSRRRAFIAPLALLLGLALAALGGCTYDEEGPPDAHFEKFATKPPRLDTVTVCHAYGCKAQTRFAFTESDIAELKALMARVPREDTPAEERRALAYAIAWMERRVAPTVGTASDRTSIDLRGSGIRPNWTASTRPPTPRAISSSSTATGSSSITRWTGPSPRTASRAGPIGRR